jgi:O-antigen/teichoic acid export membrane protein
MLALNPKQIIATIKRKTSADGHERTAMVRKNIVNSFVVKAIGIVSSLMLVPLTINYISAENYGIWLTLSSVVSWINLMDIGLGNGLRNKLTEAISNKNYHQGRIYVSTTYASLSLVVSVIVLVFVASLPFLDWAAILNTDSSRSSELQLMAIIVFSSFCLQFVFRLITVILTANQEVALGSTILMLSNLSNLIGVYLVTQLAQPSLLLLTTVFSLSPLLIYVFATLYFFGKSYRHLRPSVKLVRMKYAKELMNKSSQFFIIQIASVVVFSSSNILITQYLGNENVAVYNTVYKYFSILLIVQEIILAPMWSAITDAYLKADMVWINTIMVRLNRNVLFFGVVSLIMTILSPWVYQLWIGESLNIPFEISAYMAVYIMLNIFTRTYSSFINGVGKIRVQMITSIFTAALTIPLSIFFTEKLNLGLSGTILASSTILLLTIPIKIFQYRRLMENTAVGLWNK